MGDEKSQDEDKITSLFPRGEKPEGAAEPAEQEDRDSSGSPADVVEVDFGASQAGGHELTDVDEAKLAIFQEMIDDGMVMVTLDTRVDGVVVPGQFAGQSELRLNFSHQFHIPDFVYDEQGVRASLSFQGSRQLCDVPWPAVYILYSHASGELAIFEPFED